MSDIEEELYRRIVDLHEECHNDAVARLADVFREYEAKGASVGVAVKRAYWHIPEVPYRWLYDATGGEGGLDHVVQYQLEQLDCMGCGSRIEVVAKDRDDRERLWGIGFTCPGCMKKIEDEKSARFKQQQERVEEGLLRKDQRIAELCAMPYDDYLQSDHWQAIRLIILERDKERCRLCNAAERLQVHHSTYERRGCEHVGDLLTLCADCHQWFHDHRKLARPQ